MSFMKIKKICRKGTHYAGYDSYHWGTEKTSIGEIPSNAITK